MKGQQVRETCPAVTASPLVVLICVLLLDFIDYSVWVASNPRGNKAKQSRVLGVTAWEGGRHSSDRSECSGHRRGFAQRC